MRDALPRRPDVLFFAAVACVALISAYFLAIATTRGVATSQDFASYLGAARSLLAGRGLMIPFGSDHPVPLTHWPPLYPMLLAAAGLIAPDLVTASRWLTLSLFCLNTALLAALARRYTGSSVVGVSAGCIFAFSYRVWCVHALAISEPLFICLMLGYLYFLDRYLETAQMSPFLLSAGAVGLCLVTRFAGLPFVAGGTLLILMSRSQPRRIRWATIWTIIALAPFMWVSVWNMFRAENATDRTLAWHLPPKLFFWETLEGVSEWFLPMAVPESTRVRLAAAAVLVATLLLVIYLERWRHASRTRYLAVMLGSYALFVIVVVSFIDAGLDAPRTIAPMFPVTILMAMCLISEMARSRRHLMQVTALIVCAAVVLPNYSYLQQWILTAKQDGLGFNSVKWTDSPTLMFVKRLPPEVVIYSDLPDFLYLMTGQSARFVPVIEDPLSRQRATPPQIERAVSTIAHDARLGRAVLAYFWNDWNRLDFTIPAQELAERSGVRRVRIFDDGVVYGPDGLR